MLHFGCVLVFGGVLIGVLSSYRAFTRSPYLAFNSPYIGLLAAMEIDVKDVHQRNADSPIAVTEFGIMIEVKE